MSSQPIYLDYNATTPIDPAVVDAMLPYLRDHFGNPSSAHVYGQRAHAAVEEARKQVADLLGAAPSEIVFTAGGTEASNLAIKGVTLPILFGRSGGDCLRSGYRASFRRRFAALFRKFRNQRSTTRRGYVHVITSAIEHPATLRPCAFVEQLGQFGCRVTVLPVDRTGVVDLNRLRKELQPSATLVSIMHANNEVGTLQSIQEIAQLAHQHGALVHTDAAQSLGKIPVNVTELGVDLLTIAGHKLYAPKGVGALYVRQGVVLEPLMHGAGHEAGRRAGTENVPYIVALGAACDIARRSLPVATERLRQLRDRLWRRLVEGLGDKVVRNGHPENCLPNTLNVNFVGHIGAELLARTPEIAASTGSACHEGQVQLSPVLQAMGVPPQLGRGAVRLSVGRFTTEQEVDSAAEALIRSAAGMDSPASGTSVGAGR